MATSEPSQIFKQTIIRCARVSDAPALLAMIDELARHHGDTPTVRLSDIQDDLFGQAPWSQAIIAETSSRPIGCAILQRLYRGNSAERGADLTNLFVVDGCRGLGIGTRLTKAALEQADRWGCSFFHVGTHPDNVQAQRFYEKVGFDRAKVSGLRFHMRLKSRSPRSVPTRR